jgi:excisionase family DNA binding protein
MKRCRAIKLKHKPRLLRVPQAVEYLDGCVTESTLRQWIFHRKIESVRIGGSVCIPVAVLDALIERGKVSAV